MVENQLRQLLERLDKIHHDQRVQLSRESVDTPPLVRRREIVKVMIEIVLVGDFLEIGLLLHERYVHTERLLKSLREFRDAVADERSVEEESSDASSGWRADTESTGVVPYFGRAGDCAIDRVVVQRLEIVERCECSSSGLLNSLSGEESVGPAGLDIRDER